MHPAYASHESTPNRRQRRLRLFVLTCIAAVGAVTLSASRLEATCGDYLAPHGMVEQSRMLPTDQQPLPRSHRTPCHGPHCSQAPLQLPPSAPVVSFELQDRWGWISGVELPSLEQVSYLTRHAESVALPMIAFRLDRPPKA